MNEVSDQQIDFALQDAKLESSKGELTLFFGAIAGVGKTYAMLRAAKELLNSGKKVVIGYVQIHGRVETEELTRDIPSIPLSEINYRGANFYEPNLDAILEAKPDVVLIDELAHTNAPGLRHQKRYQDVLEILSHGIDVYSTMNVQHLESLNDLIYQTTGVKVSETVPDVILDSVDNIQIIDIPPEKLIERLKEGKIYKTQTVEKALMNFFKPGNINALRGIALKQVAGRVDKDVYEYYKEKQIESWEAVEKVLVCIDGSEFSTVLIRNAKRFASQINCEWIALYIDNFTEQNKDATFRDKLAKNIRLAEELGAEVNSVYGQDVAEEILKHATARFVTHIIVGKKLIKFFGKFWRANIADELVNSGGKFCILTYSDETQEKKRVSEKNVNQNAKNDSKLRHYVFGLGSLAIIGLLCIMLRSRLDLLNVALVLLIPVLLVAIRGDMTVSVVVVIAGILFFDFFFVPPTYTFTVGDISYIWSFFIFFLVAYIVASQAKNLKITSEVIRDREKRTRRLFKVSRRLAATFDVKRVAQIAMTVTAESLGKETMFFMKNSQHATPHLFAYYDPKSPLSAKKYSAIFEKLDAVYISQSDFAVVEWCFENKKKAGSGTDTFHAADALYIPLKGKENVYGIMGVKIKGDDITTDIKMFLDSIASVVAVSLERIAFSQKNNENTISLAKEELKNALYGSISHDLKTPLASILGMISLLKTDSDDAEIINDIIYDIKRVERFINNMLDSARLETEGAVIKKDWCDILDIFSLAATEFKNVLKDRMLNFETSDVSPILKANCVLLERVLVNLIENAIKYSPNNSNITLGFTKENGVYKIFVANEGSKIDNNDLEKIFEKFYRIKGMGDNINGSGFGLFICKKIVEAHGGKIWAKNTQTGVAIEFTLPIED